MKPLAPLPIEKSTKLRYVLILISFFPTFFVTSCATTPKPMAMSIPDNRTALIRCFIGPGKKDRFVGEGTQVVRRGPRLQFVEVVNQRWYDAPAGKCIVRFEK